MKINLATDLKTRVGDTTKDARLKNAYIEVRGEQSVVRHRPSARGGVAVGSGVAQGGYGTVLFWGDTAYTISDSTGTTWAAGTSYYIGSHVSYEFVDYWALTDHSGSQPPSSNWSTSYVPAVPFSGTYATLNPLTSSATLSNGNLTATAGSSAWAYANMTKTSGKWYMEITRNSTTTISAQTFIVCAPYVSGGSGILAGTGIEYIDQISPPVQIFRKIIDGIDTNIAFGIPSFGSVVSLYFDCDNGLIYCLVDGVNPIGSGLPIYDYGTSKTFTPAISIADDSLTFNFGQNDFVYSVPSGYNSGLYTL